MALFEIPMGFASVFMMILIGYFVLTVWFGQPKPQAVVLTKAQPRPSDGKEISPPSIASSEVNAG